MNTIAAVTPLMLRSIATRGRLLAMASLGLLGVVISIFIRRADTSADFEPAEFIGGFGLTILVPLVSLVVASAAFGNLVENQTLVYLWLRPIARWQVVVSGLIAGLVIVVPLVVVPLGVMAGLVGDGKDVQAAIVASILGTIAYVAVFTGLGLLTQRALAWGLGYILVWEGFVAGLSRGAGRFAIRSYTNSALARISDAIDLIDDPYSVSTAVIVVVAVAAAATALSSWLLSAQDIA